MKVKVKEGDRVRIIKRDETPEDRKTHRYYAYMAGMTGVVENIYGEEEVAIRIDNDCLQNPVKQVRETAEEFIQGRFADNATEELKSRLGKEEMKFGVPYVVLAKAADLESA